MPAKSENIISHCKWSRTNQLEVPQLRIRSSERVGETLWICTINATLFIVQKNGARFHSRAPVVRNVTHMAISHRASWRGHWRSIRAFATQMVRGIRLLCWGTVVQSRHRARISFFFWSVDYTAGEQHKASTVNKIRDGSQRKHRSKKIHSCSRGPEESARILFY